jgi:alkylation response protein AidB-like acyl-CoA dehydrogenase
MASVLPAERESIRAAARAFARERAPVGHLRALRDGHDPLGYSRDLWREMAGLGFAGMLLPEQYGGAGLGFAELGLVLEELGRTLAPTPLLSTALLGGAALSLGGGELLRDRVLPAIGSGDAVVALAHDEGPRHAPYAVATRAERDGQGFVLRGEKSFVVDGHGADSLVVVARTSGAPGEREGLTLFHVSGTAPGLSTRRLETVDSRNAARVVLDAVRVSQVDVLGVADRGADVLDVVLPRATAALSAEMLGGLSEAFDRTITYLKTRKQFGAYIGSFQALKHRAAWMFCEVELTRSLVAEALRAIDEGRADAALLASAAKARASDTYVLVTNEAVQMHGGVGVTDELDIGLYMKRARVAEQLLGGAAFHRDRFAKLRGY